MAPNSFRDIVDRLDDIYKFHDTRFTDDNSAMLNKILYGGVPLLATKGSNAVSTLEAVTRATDIGRLAISTLLWRLPQLLPVSKAETFHQVMCHMQLLSEEDAVELPIFHEKQKGLLCLVHALNNLLECRVFTNYCSADRLVNGMVNLNAVDGASGTGVTGNYLDQAIPRACAAINLFALLLPTLQLDALHVLRSTYSGTLGAIALRRNHYVAINVSGEHLMLVDSMRIRPQRFASIKAMNCYLTRCSIVWVVLAPNSNPMEHCCPLLKALAKDGHRGTLEDAEMAVKRMWDTHANIC